MEEEDQTCKLEIEISGKVTDVQKLFEIERCHLNIYGSTSTVEGYLVQQFPIWVIIYIYVDWCHRHHHVWISHSINYRL